MAVIRAIEQLLTTTGKRVESAAPAAGAATGAGAGAGAADKTRRYSVQNAPAASSASAAGTGAAAGAAAGAGGVLPSNVSPAEAFAMISAGRQLTFFHESLGARNAFLFHAHTAGAGKAGALYWNFEASKAELNPARCMPIAELTGQLCTCPLSVVLLCSHVRALPCCVVP
jgi:hypothetical protein